MIIGYKTNDIKIGKMVHSVPHIVDVSDYQAFSFMKVEKKRHQLTLTFYNFQPSVNTDEYVYAKKTGVLTEILFKRHENKLKLEFSLKFRKKALKFMAQEIYGKDLKPEDITLEELYVYASNILEKIQEDYKFPPYIGEISYSL